MAGVLPMKVSSDLEHKIREEILVEGEKLPSEREMSELYSVSRNVVREALKMLNEKGLVEIVTGKGAYVTVPKTDELMDKFEIAMDYSDIDPQEILEARLEIERVVARKIMENITEQQYAHVVELYRKMDDCVYDTGEFVKYDAEFHLYLSECSNNRVLKLFTSTLGKLSDRKKYLGNKGVEIIKRAQAEHKAMIEAIGNKDIEAYDAAIIRHLDCIRAHITED